MNATDRRESEAPLPTLEYATPSRKLWYVGTLTYTTAGLIAVIAWLIVGNLGLNLLARAYPNSVTLLLKNQLQASNKAIVFLGSVLPTALTLLLSPVVASWSDRARTRWGRRRPFLLFAAPLATGAVLGIAFCVELGLFLNSKLGKSSPGPASCGLVVFGFFAALYHVSNVFGGGSVLSGFFNDVLPKSALGRFIGANRVASLVMGIVFNWFIIGHVSTHFRPIFITFAILMGVTFVLMCIMVREGRYPSPGEPVGAGGPGMMLNAVESTLPTGGERPAVPPAAGSFAGRFGAEVLGYLRECFSRPYYLLVFAVITFGALALGPINSFNILFAGQMGMSVADYGKVIAINHFCGIFVAYPIGMLVDRFHVLRISLAAMALYCATALLGSVFIQGPKTFAVASFGHLFISGVYLSASGALAMVLFPREKFGQFSSASGIVTSLLGIASGLAVAHVLDLSGDNYRLTFAIAGGLAGVTVLLMVILSRRFMAMGGPNGYVAPQ